MDIQTVRTLNLVGHTYSAILEGDKMDNSRIYSVKDSIWRKLTPVLFDGRSYCVRYYDWEGSYKENNILNDNALDLHFNVIGFKAIYQGWVTCFPSNIEDVNEGEYFAFNSDDYYGDSFQLADGSIFSLVGKIENELIWQKQN